MKKILVIGFVMVLATVATFARDKVIPATSLPKAAQEFVAANFSERTITYAEADWDEYEATLDDGTEIKFKANGDWDEVKSYTGVPSTILSNVISGQIETMFPDVSIIEVEKERGNFEIKMANRMKVYFSANGKLIGQKFDD